MFKFQSTKQKLDFGNFVLWFTYQPVGWFEIYSLSFGALFPNWSYKSEFITNLALQEYTDF